MARRRLAVENTVVSNGAILSGCSVSESVISPNCRVGLDAELRGAILFDDVKVGQGAVLNRVVVDKNVVIPPGARVGVDRAEDEARVHGV